MLAQLAGASVAVVGLGVSNLALIRYLVPHGCRITALDRKTEKEMGSRWEELSRLPVEFCLGPDYLEALAGRDFRYVFLTPGMKKDQPQIRRAAARGADLWSEMRLFSHLCRAPVVGITGSAGKTTTTSLVGRILETAGRKAFVGGNIGRPLISLVDEIPPDALVVLELSSFQLELMDRSPHIAVLLNISPNHLDIHRDLAAYTEAKERLFRFQDGGDELILNGDREECLALAGRAPAGVAWFSRRREVERGCYLQGNRIRFRREGEERDLLDRRAVRLRGDHNLENVMAAATVAGMLGIPAAPLEAAVAGFSGVEHRLELVAEINGVRFVNDSIATAPDRTEAALAAFDEPIILIAGGYDKGIPFDGLARAVVGRVKVLVLVGNTAPAIKAAVAAEGSRAGRDRDPGLRVLMARDFTDAFRLAVGAAACGDVVLLSPACASYDQFASYVERGHRFKELVHALETPNRQGADT